MNIPRKTLLRLSLLVLLAACARPTCAGAASAGEVVPAPVVPPAATAGAVRPATGISVAAPVATIRPATPRSARSWLTPDPGATTSVLVIPAKEMAPQTYDRLVEDLTIMSRIIDKSLHGESDGPSHLSSLYTRGDVYGQAFFLLPGAAVPQILRSPGRGPKAIYIGGYGAVFSFQVACPLVPPPEGAEPNEAVEETDRTWAQARQELLDPRPARRKDAPSGKLYDAEAVESLRTALIAVLKHATNIRDLGPEDWLTILAQGPEATGSRPAPESALAQQLVLPRTAGSGRTLLTVRATKADIDQHAKGQLDEARFRQRVQITTH